ncbi:hypothetical protein M5G20_25985 [Pseudomonas sp. TNT2022 ID1044]|uniref:hypothetical protein n=1 Tax=Pseudomonas sp. TNT2022 ID1044 TaxID=2942636 RepID=UPI00235EC010|nr:hypothetical protein [Pseudomonas sp. TNT2022 ID1044]MDD0999294.1 hypothetical protein [Pseudomonas sp. TNT2022 ID1044]
MNVFVKALACSAVFLGVSGCSTIDGLQPTDTGITIDVPNKSYNEIWKSSVTAMSTNLAIVEMNKGAGVIKSEAPAGMATWGEVIGLFITPVSPSAESYSIRVVSKKRATYQITGQNWAPTVAARIQADLDSK